MLNLPKREIFKSPRISSILVPLYVVDIFFANLSRNKKI